MNRRVSICLRPGPWVLLPWLLALLLCLSTAAHAGPPAQDFAIPGEGDPDPALVAANGLKIDEPGGVVPLGVNPALACPGFYVLTVDDGPDPGTVPGSYGAELLLLSPGSRILAGGLNFGGEIDSSAPGYAAFTIANPLNENQTLSVNLTGYRVLAGNPNIRLRVTLERRLPSTQTILSQVVTVGANSPYFTQTIVSPGFYVATVEPLDFLSGSDGIFGMSLLSSYTNRPGGGFQGGVVVGGYHPGMRTSGFAGFCLPDAHNVQIRTEGRPTRGAAGAGDLRIQVLNAGGSVVYTNPTSGGGGGGTDPNGTCATAEPRSVPSTFSGTISPATDLDFYRFTLSSAATITAEATSDFDSYGALYDVNCNLIAEDDDGGNGVDFRLVRTLSAGTYYLRVSSFLGGSTGNYSIALTSTGGGGGSVNATVRVQNQLLYAIAVRANGVFLGNVNGGATTDLPYSGSSSVSVTWDLNRPTVGSSPLGETMSGSFSQTTVASGQLLNYTVDNVVGSTPYFVPVITNQTSSVLLMGVNMGLVSENRCNCTVPAFGQNVALGYYRLFSNSNVRGYRSGSNYTGPYIFWGSDPGGSGTLLPSIVQSGSGRASLSATSAP